MRSSWARCISSRRSEHSTASSAFSPLVGEEAAFEREVLRNISATVRADTDTDRAGIPNSRRKHDLMEGLRCEPFLARLHLEKKVSGTGAVQGPPDLI